MTDRTVTLSVPAEPAFARSVRMMAANLAVCCEMSVEDVEDVRMAAEEGFVYACATRPETCDIVFSLNPSSMVMGFSLGETVPEDTDDQSIDLIELLLAAVCDDFGVSEDGSQLAIYKKVGADNDR